MLCLIIQNRIITFTPPKLANSKMKVLFFSAIILLSTACRGGQATEPKPGENDTLPKPVPLEELYLPDTVYASAKKVSFVVEQEDSLDYFLKDVEDRYAADNSSFTFRRNMLRDASFGGTLEKRPETVEIAWQFNTPEDNYKTSLGNWGGGTGWTGQPIYVRDGEKEEIFFASLNSKAYFLDFNTGKRSRPDLDVLNTIKGSPSLDPELKNLYIGHGVSRKTPMCLLVVDLLKHEITYKFSDKKAWRNWSAFDSSPVVAGGYLIWPGENGSLYKFEREQGSLKLLQTLRYKVNGAAPGIESSIAIWRNYGWFQDNAGNILCVNLNTMKPIWHYWNHDDSDGTVVCRVENGIPYVYAASEVDRQGMSGSCFFIKINGLDGTVVWEQKIPCRRIDLGGKILDGGMYSTPLLGAGDCNGMIFANVCRNKAAKTNGELMALSTEDGSILYSVPLKQFCWSSPVAFYDKEKNMYIFTGDGEGNIYLIEGKTGQVIYTKKVAYNFESSPTVAGNAAVVGSRVNGIFKFVIK
ncbi:MAG: dehydrogenase [Bacteroidales bacterium]|nr:dehydrogenase [Bacteroidales bacterium]